MITPPNKTTTETYWMISTFINGKWDHDTGQFVNREHCEDWIREHPIRPPGYEYFPYRCTETIVKEYDAK